MSGDRADFDCVLEQKRLLTTGRPLEVERIWHVARSKGRTLDFAPIRCSADEGIVLPGPIERRAPTCPDCLAAVALSPAASGAAPYEEETNG